MGRLSVLVCVVVLSLVAAATRLAMASRGVDVSDQVLPATWKCLKEHGYTFGIVRGFHSYGGVDTTCPHTIYNAWDGGMDHVDVYLFPCQGKSAHGQVSELVKYLHSYNCTYGKIWIDLETNPSPGCGWSSERDINCKYLGELLGAGHSEKRNMGVYASESMWSSIVGDSCTVAKDHPLWYAHYDNNPSFSDFRSFGGWKHPAIKQYADSIGGICGGLGADANFA